MIVKLKNRQNRKQILAPESSTVDLDDDHKVKCVPCETRRKALRLIYEQYYPGKGTNGPDSIALVDAPANVSDSTTTLESETNQTQNSANLDISNKQPKFQISASGSNDIDSIQYEEEDDE